MKPKREFSNAFRAFVNKYINSVEQIEVLLLLHEHVDRFWEIDEISTLLRSTPSSIASRIKGLLLGRLVTHEPQSGYRYAASGRLHRFVEMLREEYASRRFSLIELVFSHTDAARSFADAFRLRDDDDECDG